MICDMSARSRCACGTTHRVFDHNYPAGSALTEGPHRGADLLRWPQPEYRHRVEPVNVRDQHRHREALREISVRSVTTREETDHEQQRDGDKVGREQVHLDDLDHELAQRLAHWTRSATSTPSAERTCAAAETASVPPSGPPGAVRLVVTELAREEDGDDDLEQRALDEEHRDGPHDRVADVEPFEVEEL